MEEIEAFVRKLCTEGDLGVLTKKLIRTQYQAHYNKATVTREEKDKINEVLEMVIQELADQAKSKKRKAAALAASLSDEDDQSLKGKPMTSDKKAKRELSEPDEDFDKDTPVKKPKKKRARLELDSSDEDEVPLRATSESVNGEEVRKDSDGDSTEVQSDAETADPSPPPKKSKKKKLKRQVDSSDEDDQPLKPTPALVDDDTGETNHDTSHLSEDTISPPKRKKSKKRKPKQQVDSSDADDEPLKPRPASANGHTEDCHDTAQHSEDDTASPKRKKPKKRKPKLHVDSSDADDEPLKPRPVSTNGHTEDCHDNAQHSEDDTASQKRKKSKKRKPKQQVDSSDADDEPLRPRPASANGHTEDCHDSAQLSEDDTTSPKRKTSLKAPKLVFISSDDGVSPMKVKLKPSHDSESDLDTSSLSSDDESKQLPEATKPPGPRIKFTMKKVQPAEKPQSEKAKAQGSKKTKAAQPEQEEAPYLKRLRLICRKVGIFVRNDTHFAGCTSDKQKIERLKEALKKAGMKGQPSLSKVDSVNLRREAEALDTTNIIETSGRPKRQLKDPFNSTSPKKSLSPIKQQFSRIKDLISESESD